MEDMLGRRNLKSSAEALNGILSRLSGSGLREQLVSLNNAYGRITSRDLFAPEDLPGFSRSTVDGYAVRFADTFGASETMPSYFSLTKEIFMGLEPDIRLLKGEAAKVPTGGMLPEGADSVVMFEHVQAVDGSMIEVLRPVAPGENVIHAGEDVKKGDVVIRRGHILRPQDIGACAGLGIIEISVFRKPVICIISTGDEILPPEAVPAPGQVRDINSYLLYGLVEQEGCEARRKGIIRDDYDEIRTVIESEAKDCDAVLISGGTSVGTKDMIARVINDIGQPGVIFHGVAMKPGKPLIGGIIKGLPVFGLPGHPAAVAVCFDVFVKPVLRVLSGIETPLFIQRLITARLSRNVSSSQGREEHVRVMLESREDGLWAVPVLGKSGLITTLVKADGTFVVPSGLNGIEMGTAISVILF